MNVPTLLAFSLYLIMMLAIGVFFYLRTKNLSDYILGGRQLNGAVAALSAGASDMSGWLLLGLPGAIYASGLNNAWIGIGLIIGAFLNWQFVARPLRVYTELSGDSITLPDFLENRFNDTSHLLRLTSASVILIFFTIYTSAGLVGGAILFEKTFSLDYNMALWIGTIVIVSYTFLGGFMAVSWTDFFQGILMFLALMVIPIYAMSQIGGWEATLETVHSINPEYIDIFSGMSLFSITSLMVWGLGYFGQPHILARFMSVKSPSSIPMAQLIGMLWMILSLTGAVLTGLVGIAYFSDLPLANPETVFIALNQAIMNPWVGGLLLAAILSAIMSTVDSQLLVSSSTIAEDFYKKMLHKNAQQKHLVWIGRASVVGIALIAVTLASDRESSVLDLVAYAWGGFGAAFGPVIILSLFWKRMTRNGALSGIISGAITVILWKQLQGGVFDMYEILPGFVISSCCIITASLLDKRPEKAIETEFEKAKKAC